MDNKISVTKLSKNYRRLLNTNAIENGLRFLYSRVEVVLYLKSGLLEGYRE